MYLAYFYYDAEHGRGTCRIGRQRSSFCSLINKRIIAPRQSSKNNLNTFLFLELNVFVLVLCCLFLMNAFSYYNSDLFVVKVVFIIEGWKLEG